MTLKNSLWLSLALLASVSFAETYTWHGEGEQSLPAGGAWGSPGNWRNSSGGVASEAPGADDIALFAQPTKTTRTPFVITFDKDYTIGKMNQNAMSPSVTFDLGGHTLSATDGFVSNLTFDWPRWVVTNGTFHAKTVEIGLSTDRAYGSGTLSVNGDSSTMVVDGALKVTGSGAKFEMHNGATASCKQFFGTTRVDEKEYGQAIVEGVGTSLLVTNSTFVISDYFKFYLNNGAKLVVSNSSDRVQIGRYDTRPNTLMCVDDATFEVYGRDVTVGDADTAKHRGCQLILTNNATMTMAKSLYLGRGHLNAVMTNHTLTVANGSTLTGGASSDILAYGMDVGKVYFSGYNNINVLDASVSVRNLKFGNLAKPVSSNGVLRVEGSRAKIALSGTAATAFQLRMGADLRITIPETGFVSTPIQIPNGGATVLDDAENGAKDIGFFFDAGAYSRKHKGRPVTLIECGLDSEAALQHLVDNVTYVNTPENLRGTLEVVDGKTLVYNPPPAPGLMLLIK